MLGYGDLQRQPTQAHYLDICSMARSKFPLNQLEDIQNGLTKIHQLHYQKMVNILFEMSIC